jgi:fumarate hydratase subunit alpha
VGRGLKKPYFKTVIVFALLYMDCGMNSKRARGGFRLRTIQAQQITDAVAELCIRANRELPPDITQCVREAAEKEMWPMAKTSLRLIQDNVVAAKNGDLPICQDTGMACVFAEVGQDLHIDGDFESAVNEGVRKGYTEGYLRKSVVADPLRRVNTEDNTPAVITVRLVPGEKLRLTVLPKGFGSENMSAIAMLKPAQGEQGVKDFVLETVRRAGPNPCPPIVVGLGIGGTFDRVALLAKEALLRPITVRNEDPYYRAMEEELLEKINALGIGPQGFGGRATALGVNIEVMPTHVAGLPVAVNISCYVTRRAAAVI